MQFAIIGLELVARPPALGKDGVLNPHLIPVARGRAPADLLLANARIVNVFTGQVQSGNVAISGGLVAGVGDYDDAAQVVDVAGAFVAPGFIDGHVHLESSMLGVAQYARAVVPRGTSAIITDFHEIANVAGINGLRCMLDAAHRLPLDVFLMAPSCVPATNLETSGASLDSQTLRRILKWKRCIGLGEMMNFPGVLNADPAVMSKIGQALGRAVDGHAPGLHGKDLNAYVAAGIHSDHESVTLDEAREKLGLGMHIMIREGSSEKNLEALLPLVTDKTYPRCMFVVDDRTCVDLLNDGDLDAVLRKAIRLGLDPVRAIQMVTINPARYFRLHGLGAVAPGYMADLIVLDDLRDVRVHSVFHQGKLVAQLGQSLFSGTSFMSRTAFSSKGAPSPSLGRTVNVRPFAHDAFRAAVPTARPHQRIRVNAIEIVPGQIITRKGSADMEVVDGEVKPDPGRDLLKLVVVERHHSTGNIGIGFVKGVGLSRGALASSVAHDSHNIVAVGVDDQSIQTAVDEIVRLQGGLVAAEGLRVLAALPLPVAGLLSEKSLEDTVQELARLENVAFQLGVNLTSPFSALSFLALPVIPELRLTDLGLVDVTQFRTIPMFADDPGI